LIQQGLELFPLPTPLDIKIVKAGLEVDRRILIGMMPEPAHLTAKRLLRRAVVFRHMITPRAALPAVAAGYGAAAAAAEVAGGAGVGWGAAADWECGVGFGAAAAAAG
jgi:hypothetical protein